jgi:hypothetical protein
VSFVCAIAFGAAVVLAVLRRELPLRRLAGTAIVAYRHDGWVEAPWRG